MRSRRPSVGGAYFMLQDIDVPDAKNQMITFEVDDLGRLLVRN